MFYPHTPAEVLALDILHDAGGQHVTRDTVEHHLGGPTGRALWGDEMFADTVTAAR